MLMPSAAESMIRLFKVYAVKPLSLFKVNFSPPILKTLKLCKHLLTKKLINVVLFKKVAILPSPFVCI